MPFAPSLYDPWTVAASLLIASFASYVALDLAKRVRTRDRAAAIAWWAGGSIAMGTGIWAMHFVGMLGFSLPVPLGYTSGWTFTSWLAGVLVSGVALGVASRGRLTAPRLVAGSLAMGAGICAMHYCGMAALDMSPGIVWDRTLVAASAGIAVGASAAALLIFSFLRRVNGQRSASFQAVAAVVMGMAISGMHYTGMAAASFPAGSVCLSASGLSGTHLGTLLMLASVGLLVATWLVSILDARMHGRAVALAESLRLANAQLQEANEELRRRAFVDPLTELPNRVLFEDRLAHAVARSERAHDRVAGRHQEKLAVLFIDLDGFKPVNDSYGHGVGDVVLKQAADRLRRSARDSDTVARVGGDEFLLLMEGGVTEADCATLARRTISALRQPFELEGRRIEIAASIGIALYPEHGAGHKLIGHADAAMYAAKHAGGNTFVLFEPHMDADPLNQLSLQADLRHAAGRGQLSLHYQPKVDGHRGLIHGVEALLRWQHPQRGSISPATFIPLAERFGLMGAIGHWVIEEACRQMREWNDRGMRIRVAINLSVHQLREDDLAERIRRALEHQGVDPAHLLCEITESVAMEDIEASQRAFENLARIGVFLSIDDFGTGYSSLSYLRQLPAREVKIDRGFVTDLEHSADARAIVDAVVRLAHALGLRVVAEGVETTGQRDLLMGFGCDELQGFLFARPMPAGELLQWALGHAPDVAPEAMPDFAPSVIDENLR
jgi:diguanylate cyclase